ncbi:methyltransferase like 7A, transcript variant X1 [Ictidomys tridecemlineatus]|uniref:Thiol methyltransferase 1A n=1 Tax=Ictidomys tridecemlineatus TaxID=43179 RepID=I3MZK1_ICTTR|nr:methyltransferase-like protein 7A isoform X2 [Ictidomys tridecemlineatus]KAG3291968.1 methyltransferase like 7A, transcript variant X1 [Ictidomys tridecemlineatus]
MAFTVFILQLAVRILSFPLYLLKFLGLWNQISKKWFPYYMMKFSTTYNEQMAGKKQELFSKLQDFAGPSGKLSLLEVGSGTGTNFKFYPPGCRVTCVDPNPNFEKFLFKSIAENRHLQFERFLVAAGENMHQVTDSSVDVVVCTTVLCSVENQEQMLREVCRVLRPGGAFFFIEHVADEHSTWNYFWQQVIEPAWYLVFDGCNLTRESWKALERASFSKLKLQHIQPPLSCKVLRPHVYGYAVK